MTLSTVDNSRCPNCATPLVERTTKQPALFLHGGYGATEMVVVAHCEICGFQLMRERSEVRPEAS